MRTAIIRNPNFKDYNLIAEELKFISGIRELYVDEALYNEYVFMFPTYIRDDNDNYDAYLIMYDGSSYIDNYVSKLPREKFVLLKYVY